MSSPTSKRKLNYTQAIKIAPSMSSLFIVWNVLNQSDMLPADFLIIYGQFNFVQLIVSI